MVQAALGDVFFDRPERLQRLGLEFSIVDAGFHLVVSPLVVLQDLTPDRSAAPIPRNERPEPRGRDVSRAACGLERCSPRPSESETSSELGLRFDSGSEALLLRSQLGRELLAKVLRLEDRANLHFSPATEWRPLEPVDRLVHRFHLPQPEPGDELLRLG